MKHQILSCEIPEYGRRNSKKITLKVCACTILGSDFMYAKYRQEWRKLWQLR